MADEYNDAVEGLAPAAPRSEYADAVAGMVDAHDTKLRSTLYGAIKSNPDTFARSRDLEAQTGIPADVVERNFDFVDSLAKTTDYDHMTRSLPVLRKLMSDSGFAKVAHDDLDNASMLERAARNLAAGAGPRFSEGGYGVLEAGGDVLSALGDIPLKAGLIPTNPFSDVPEFFAEQRRNAKAIADAWQGDLSKAGTIERGVYSGVQSVGLNLPTMLAAIFGGQPELALGVMAGVTGGQEYGAAKDKGLEPGVAQPYALSQAVIEYATEKIPVNKLFGDIAEHTGLWKTLLHQLATEVPGEQVATLAQDLNQWAVLNPDQPFSEYLKQRPSAATETLIATLIGAGLQSGGAAGVAHLAHGRGETARAELADANAKKLEELFTLAAESKLAERAPDHLESLVQQAAGDTTDVYVDARELAAVLEQSEVTPDQVSPAVAAQMQEALAAGGDVRIPIGEYAARIAPTDLAAKLAPHLRTSPEAMSPKEAETFHQAGAEDLKKQAEEALQVHADDLEHQTSVQQVGQTVLDQLQKANRFTPDVNAAYASMVKDFYTVTAEKLGVKPHELYEKYPLRVTAEELTHGMEQSAYHGSPHLFDRFSVDKIGTGEGAQVYGHGLYFAENPAIAEHYRATLAGEEPLQSVTIAGRTMGEHNDWDYNPTVNDDYDNARSSVIENLLLHEGELRAAAKTGGQEAVKKIALDEVKRLRDDEALLEQLDVLPPGTQKRLAALDRLRRDIERKGVQVKIGPEPGAVYEVDIPDGAVEKMLDWDKPLKDQPDAVKAVANELFRPRLKTRDIGSGLVDVYEEGPKAGSYGSGIVGGSLGAFPADKVAEVLSHPADYYPYKGEQLYAQLAEHLTPPPPAENAGTPKGWGSVQRGDEGQKYASKFLSEHGIPGVKYYDANARSDRKGSRNLVVFDDSHVKITHVNGKPVAQTFNQDADSHAALAAFKPETGTTLMPAAMFAALALPMDESAERADPQGSYSTIKSAPHNLAPLLLYVERGEDGTWHVESHDGRHRAAVVRDVYGDGALVPVKLVEVSHDRNPDRARVIGPAPDLAGQTVLNEDGTGFVQLPASTLNQDLTGEPASGLTELMQGQTSAPRGQIALDGQGGALISLLKNADLSTFLHESGHFFLEVYADIAAQPNAPQGIVDDFGTFLKWAGVESPQAWQAMTLEQRRPAHEKFARGFEAYLFEGKAPTPELNSLFSRFRAWMLNVYKSLTQLNVQLTDEVRNVFNRMLASDKAIDAAEHARQAQPMFKSAEEAGMTGDEWQTYTDANQKAHDTALEELEGRSLRDMQWASNARGRELKKLQADALAKRKAIHDEAVLDVAAEPVYQAQRFLTTGKVTVATGEELKVEGPFRFDRELVEKGGYDARQMAKLEPYLRKNGLSSDHVAEMFEFSSGDHLIKAITDSPPLKESIEAVTDQRMLEKYGDITDPKALARAADEAVHNEARTKFVATELRALDRMMRANSPTPNGASVNVNTKAAKEFAETIIARKKIRDVKPPQFAAAEAKAAKASTKELAAGNLAGAAAEKRNQLVNGYATRAAYDVLTEVEKARDYLKKFDNEGTRKSLDPDYIEQIDQLLERFDLRRRTASPAELAKRKALVEWVESQRELGFEPSIDDSLLNEARQTPYRELSVEQFRGLVDTVRNIEHLGRLKHKLLVAADQRELAAAVADAVKEIEDNATKTLPERLERNSWADSFKDGVQGFFAMHRKFASIIYQMAGQKDGGVLWNLLVRPLNDAGNREATMRADATAAMTNLLKPILKSGPLNGDKRYIPAIGRSLTREGRLSVALNQGTETNKRRVLDGDKWSPSQVDAILSTLTKEEWDFVQGVWDHIGSYWAESAAQQKRVTGLTPEKVEATPVQTLHGEYRGGYYPIKYDPSRSSKAESDSDAEAIRQTLQGVYIRATTRRGHLKSRVDTVLRPMRKDLGVVFEHLTQVIHTLAFHEYLIDANRLVRAGQLDKAIRDHYGPQYLTQMKKTLEDVAKGETPAQNAFERSINYLRTGSTVAGLGWNLTTALLQPIGLTQSMARIGTKHVAKGLVEWMGSPAHMQKTVENVYAKSPFMKLRAQTMQREISELHNKIHGAKATVLTASFFYLIQRLQTVADMPTWLGQYHKSIDEGRDEATAVALADQAVLDAQGGGQVKDLAAIQRGGPMMKLWTNFYSFFNTTYNLSAEAVHRTNFKKPGDVGRLAVDFMLLYIMPATLSTLLKSAMPGGDDDPDKLAKRLVTDNLGYMLGSMVLLREVGSAVSGYDYKGPAGMRFIADFSNAMKQAEQGELDPAAVRAFLNVAGVLFHAPAGQIWRTGAGIYALANGDTENPAAVIAGPPH